jgi:hypothetical protein
MALLQGTVLEKHQELLRDGNAYDTRCGLDSQRGTPFFEPFQHIIHREQ